MKSRLLVGIALALALATGVAAAPAFAGTAFTWSGADMSSANWSAADNWAGELAPSASDPSDLLDFPASLSGGDCASTQTDACYASEDDIPGYAVDGITLDDGGSDDYLLQADSDSDTLALGSAGITATTSSSAQGGAEIGVPIELTAPQNWSVDGGPAGQGQVLLDRGLSAASTTNDTLEVELADFGFLTLSGDNEVGSFTIDGTDPTADNGWVDLAGGELNATDGQTTALLNAGLLGTGTTGTLIDDGAGAVSPGSPTGTLAVDGSLLVGDDGVIEPLIGGAPGSDSSELTTTGNIELLSPTGAYLAVGTTSEENSCPSVAVGSTYTLISTTGSINGQFANIPASGDVIAMDCTGPTVPQLTIDYNTTGSPQTITATVSAPASPSPTTTALSTHETWTPDAPVTLNATVTSSGGTPQGSVEFEQSVSPFTPPATGGVPASSIPQPSWTAIPGCSAVPLVAAGGSATAACNFTNPPAGNYLQLRAVFVPAASSAFEPSTSDGPGGPIEGAPAVSSIGLGLTTNVKGDAMVITMRCPTGSGCDVKMLMAASETLKHGHVVAASASKKAVIVATDTLTLPGGATETVTLRLNGAGMKLLKKFHHLTAKLSVSSNGDPILGANFSFKTPKRKPAAHAPRAGSVHAPIRRGSHATPGTAQELSSARSDWRGERLVASAAVGS